MKNLSRSFLMMLLGQLSLVSAVAGPDRGAVLGWGSNGSGEATPPAGLSNVVAISAGYNYGIALKSDGTVVQWGSDTNTPAGLSNVVAVSAGWGGLALKSDGTVLGWLGNGWSAGNVPPDLTNVTAISSAADSDFRHNMALRSDGTIVDDFGSPDGLGRVVAISAGPSFSLALRPDGTIAAWGNDDYGQIDVPPWLKDVVAISAGGFHTLALKRDGRVLAWGLDDVGQSDVPADLTNAVAIAAGDEYSLALRNDGTVVGWGWNNANQISIPPGLSNVVAISAGWYHSLALTQVVHYVNLSNANPVAPYLSWSTAATNIQDAVDAASPGNRILVSDGVYRVGGRPVAPGALSNRVAVTKPVRIQSVHGPATTIIEGRKVPGDTFGDDAIRCAYLATDAWLGGFTLTNGATRAEGFQFLDQEGGGVLCESQTSVVSNCWLRGNAASDSGGGAYEGTLVGCRLVGNSVLFSGGGSFASALNGCFVAFNTAGTDHAGAYGVLNNCLVVSNSAATHAGGGGGPLTNCTLVGNSAGSGGGATYEASAYNCILYYNSDNGLGSMTFFCATPGPGGVGNITNAPRFVDMAAGDFRLQTNSPCINAGFNGFAAPGTDAYGNTRIAGGTVDIGAHEIQNPGSLISYAWLEQYGFPTDGSADHADPDADRMDNWQEWVTGTTPTNGASVLRMLSPVAPTVTIRWQSVLNRTYFVQRATDLTAPFPFQTVAAAVPGQDGTTAFTDTNASGKGPYFYRVGVSQ